MSIFKNKKYIFDGGMGQLLIDKGMVSNGTLWSATALVDESLHSFVLDSHLEFIEAGAEIIITNNFIQPSHGARRGGSFELLLT